MKRLFLLYCCVLAAPAFAKVEEKDLNLPKEVSWTLHVMKGQDMASLQKHELKGEKLEVPLVGTGWICETMPDPAGNKAKMALACKSEDHFVALPAICAPGYAELSTVTLGSKDDFYSLQLLCTVPKKKAAKKKG